jgi:hypothetical protein
MVTKINGHAIYWNGHLCEGDRMHPSDKTTFLLWTRCQKLYVRAGSAHELGPQDLITCGAVSVCSSGF